jgi:putative ABC transport system ATP-binding protein
MSRVSEPLLRAVAISRAFALGAGAVVALDRVSFQLEPGEWVALSGPSGSGKTTLLNILGGLDRPSSGQLLIGGRDIAGFTSDQLADYRRSRIGFIFQSFRLLAYLDALDNVALPLLLSGVTRTAARARARGLLDRVGLAQRASHHPGQLSGGEQQRVAVARAIALAPALLLADEPTGNLDSPAATELMDLFDALRRSEGLALVVATHNSEVRARAMRVVNLRAGRTTDAPAR